jgi:hypothetical protein
MLQEILAAISLGQRLLKSLAALRKDAASFRSEGSQTGAAFAQLDALHKRTGDLEIISREQDARIGEVESILKDSMLVTEALARRVGTIFWIALTGCATGLVALILSAIALSRALH